MSLHVEVNNKSCALVMHIIDPTETLKRLTIFFQDRHIPIDSVQMHRYRDGEASLIINCKIEKDRILRTRQLMENLQGIIKLEWLEGRP